MFAEGKTFLLRSAVFVGLASVVTTIIYFTPVPDIDFASCERPCHELDWPMICRVKFTIESYHSLTRWCGECPRNTSDCYRTHCVAADGHRRGLLTANRQVPGPVINVCENDILLVDVVNRVPGQEMSIHWRGQPQKETPVMDGVPMVSHCPIPSHTTFQYKFRASRAGTHLWHSFTGSESTETLFGALVVRHPESREPHLQLYDDDSHVVLFNEWRHSDKLETTGISPGHGTILINGRGRNEADATPTPLSMFTVRQHKRHRFRLAHAGGTNNCPLNVEMQQHTMKLIYLDGSPVEPRDVSSLVLVPGERADVILLADQPVSSYWLRVSTVGSCGPDTLQGAAVIRYEGADDSMPAHTADSNVVASEDLRTPVQLLGSYHQSCNNVVEDGNAICNTDVESLHRLPQELSHTKMDTTLYLPFGYKLVPMENVTGRILTPDDDSDKVRVPHVNNLTFMLPSSPLLFQFDDVDADIVCNKDDLPSYCRGGSSGDFCQCTHSMDIPLGNTVELLLINEGGGDEGDSVLYLHGYTFYLMGMTQLEHTPTVAEVQGLDRRGALITRNFKNPVLKDTLFIPKNGVAVIRFKADNPGYWLLHEQRITHWSAGLAVLLHVGSSSDTPSAPSDFPRCGNWVGPHFFLI